MLHALAQSERTWVGDARQLLSLWRALGLVQHHDIITGPCPPSCSLFHPHEVLSACLLAFTRASLLAFTRASLLCGFDCFVSAVPHNAAPHHTITLD